MGGWSRWWWIWWRPRRWWWLSRRRLWRWWPSWQWLSQPWLARQQVIRTMRRLIKAVRGIPMRLPAVYLTASARWFTALALLTIATLAPAASWDDDSQFVSLGPRSGITSFVLTRG